MPNDNEEGYSDRIRLSMLEAKVNAIPESDTTSTTTTSSSTSTSTGNYTAIAETALTLTQDGAWHTKTVAGIPTSAKRLHLSVVEFVTDRIIAEFFLATNDGTHATYITVAEADTDFGSNWHQFRHGEDVAVKPTFDYKIDNTSGFWVVTAYIRGYWS